LIWRYLNESGEAACERRCSPVAYAVSSLYFAAVGSLHSAADRSRCLQACGTQSLSLATRGCSTSRTSTPTRCRRVRSSPSSRRACSTWSWRLTLTMCALSPCSPWSAPGQHFCACAGEQRTCLRGRLEPGQRAPPDWLARGCDQPAVPGEWPARSGCLYKESALGAAWSNALADC